MLARHTSRWLGSLALASVGLLVVGDRALAVKEPVAVPGSIWDTFGPAKLSGKGAGSDRANIEGIVGFGPLDGLPGNGFGLVLEAADLLVLGTYEEAKPGKPSIAVDLEDLEEGLALSLGFPTTVQSAKVKAKLKSRRGVETIKVSFQAKFESCAPLEGGGVGCGKLKLQYKGVGLRRDPEPPLEEI